MFLAGLFLVGLLSGVAGWAQSPRPGAAPAEADEHGKGLYARENLVAWCIVPFDAKRRGPEERAAMLQRLGFKHFAYDWRAEHIPTFDAEIEALKRHGIALDAFWAAGELNRETQMILDTLRRHGIKAELWVQLDMGADPVVGDEQERRVELAAAKLRPLAEEARKGGCSLALYNHGGWFGEPENQIAIIERLKSRGIANIGIVYNLHHGHDHLDRFADLLAKMKPYLRGMNLNGMVRGGEEKGLKIVPLGQGERDLDLLRTIRDSGYRGPIGILGHTQDDAEERLRDNLDGLDWLVPQLEGEPAGPPPKPRTFRPADRSPAGRAASKVPANGAATFDPRRVATLIAEARQDGDPGRGAEVFVDAKFTCVACHKVGPQGGSIGPELTSLSRCMSPEQIVESVLWPRQKVKEGYMAIAVATADGRVIQGYTLDETDRRLALREAATGRRIEIARADIEEVREQGSLMPEGLAEAMSPPQRRDLIRFLLELGHSPDGGDDPLRGHGHAPASFPYDRKPLRPEHWPHWEHPVNRERVYDFYAKEAEHFRQGATVPSLLPPFPGLDGGTHGHWGNQNDATWVDGRWNRTDLGSVMSGVFRGKGLIVPKGVCVRLGERGEMAACFDPETLSYKALWRGGFVKFSPARHGFLDGLIMDGSPLPRPAGEAPQRPFKYHGFYRHGKRIIFAYRIGETEMLDSPWVEDGNFTRTVGPAEGHPLAASTRGGPSQWPQVLETRGKRGETRPYAVDTIEPPFRNPWNALMFIGDHDFFPDGTAMICTMQGDVWRVEGLDDDLTSVRWRRFATGLHQPLGLVIADGRVHVIGRDQLTRLHDRDGDGEADFHECVSNAFETSPGGHDFVCGLQRDGAGDFYTVSGNQGLLKIAADGRKAEVLATGFRNPAGLGLSPEGVLTVPGSEGEWSPASMICEVRPGGFYGYRGPKGGRPPDLPLVYLPRGLDNSSGGQVYVTGDRWGPLQGQMLHLSFGAGTSFLVLREQVDGQPQGAVVPLATEFLSGAHRGRFNPKDGQLYVSGLSGWGSYTVADGSFDRVRYTGDPVQLPIAYHAHQNGVLVTFTRPPDRAVAEVPKSHFAQAWNYRYGPAYGSPELSPRHPGILGHDPLEIRSATVLGDERSLFLEIPDLRPVNQLHLHLRVDDGPPQDLFATVHKLAAPFTGFPGYRPISKPIAAHPILTDLALAKKSVPNPWRRPIPGARPVEIEAGTNLTFSAKSFTVRAGEPIKLTFVNPDVVPHNWALINPGTLPEVGELANKLVADPDAVWRHYIPKTDDVLVHTDVVDPQGQFSIQFRAPAEKGRYPYLCTFPGHWMVMNGVMIVQ